MITEANIPQVLKNEILARDSFRCTKCGTPAVSGDVLTVYSLAAGTPEEKNPTNLQTICSSCLNAMNGARVYQSLPQLIERRKQLQIVMESAISQKGFEREQINEIVKYIEEILAPDHKVSAEDRFVIGNGIRLLGFLPVLEIIDVAYYTKIKFKDGIITSQSKYEFLQAIIQYNRHNIKTPLDQAIAITVGACKKQFYTAYAETAKSVLRRYVDLLSPYYSEEFLSADIGINGPVNKHVWSSPKAFDWEKYLNAHCKELLKAKGVDV